MAAIIAVPVAALILLRRRRRRRRRARRRERRRERRERIRERMGEHGAGGSTASAQSSHPFRIEIVRKPWMTRGEDYIEVPVLALKYALSTSELTGIPLSRVLFSYGTNRLGERWGTNVRIYARTPEEIDEHVEELKRLLE